MAESLKVEHLNPRKFACAGQLGFPLSQDMTALRKWGGHAVRQAR